MEKTHKFIGFMDFKPCKTYIVEKRPPNYVCASMAYIYHPKGQKIIIEGEVMYNGVKCILVDTEKAKKQIEIIE